MIIGTARGVRCGRIDFHAKRFFHLTAFDSPGSIGLILLIKKRNSDFFLNSTCSECRSVKTQFFVVVVEQGGELNER